MDMNFEPILSSVRSLAAQCRSRWHLLFARPVILSIAYVCVIYSILYICACVYSSVRPYGVRNALASVHFVIVWRSLFIVMARWWCVVARSATSAAPCSVYAWCTAPFDFFSTRSPRRNIYISIYIMPQPAIAIPAISTMTIHKQRRRVIHTNNGMAWIYYSRPAPISLIAIVLYYIFRFGFYAKPCIFAPPWRHKLW